MASQITATLPTLNFPKEVDYPTQEDWAAFSAAAELNFGILGGSWSTQMQQWKTEANAMSTELNNNANIAQSVANYQGDWVSQGYTLGQTVSVSGIYYICKLTHATGQNPTVGGSLYWNLVIGNWDLKVNTDMSGYSSKTTPIDADLFYLGDSASSFGLKKLSWANAKSTFKTYFDTLYTVVASSETASGVIELATAAEAQAGTDDLRAITPLQLFNSLKGSRQSLTTSGYQKLHGGLIIQWGKATTSFTGTSITFPISFPTAGLISLATRYDSSPLTQSTGYAGKVATNSLTTNGMTIYGESGTNLTSWIAIGY